MYCMHWFFLQKAKKKCCSFFAQTLNKLKLLTKIYLYLVLTKRISFAMICLKKRFHSTALFESVYRQIQQEQRGNV